MKKVKNIIGGIAIFVFFWIALSTAANALYAGNVYINNNLFEAGVTVKFFNGGCNQGSTDNIPEQAISSVGNYQRYEFQNLPSAGMTVLFEKAGGTSGLYAIAGTNGLGANQPVDSTIDSVTYYYKGKPAPPIVADSGGIVSGFETAKLKYTLDTNYQYNAVYFRLAGTVNNQVLSDVISGINKSSGQPEDTTDIASSYPFGEYVDGRKLTPGTTYYIGLWGTVAGVADSSDYSTNGNSGTTGVLVFTTKQGGGPGTPGVYHWNFIKTTDLGINQFQFYMDPESTTPISYMFNSNLTELTDKTVAGLVKAINSVAGSDIIKTIGWWNQLTGDGKQKMDGYTITDYDADHNPTMVPSNGIVANEPLVKNRTYQVSVSANLADFTIQQVAP
jgi:hypothetical protein